MSKLPLAVLLAGILAGCASQSPQESRVKPGELIANEWQRPTAGSGTLIITRDSGFGGSACPMFTYLDGKPFGSLWTSERITIYPGAGEHVAGVQFGKKGTLCDKDDAKSITIVSGETKRFRISFSDNGELKIQPSAF
jgi:hypothetical protein